MTFWPSFPTAHSFWRQSCWSRLSHFPNPKRHATTLSGTDYLDPTKRLPYPFPEHPRPTPYEIFHLPFGASSTDIKSRYYDLVRYHHPDSPYARMHTPCPNKRNSRFQSILSAYKTLQNPSSARAGKAGRAYYGHGSGFDPYMAELDRRRSTSQHAEYMKQQREAMKDESRRREQEEWDKSAGGSRERLMIALGVFALLGGLYPSFFLLPLHMEKTHQSAVVNLAKARNDAREVGHLRREEVRKRVKYMKTNTKGTDDPNVDV